MKKESTGEAYSGKQAVAMEKWYENTWYFRKCSWDFTVCNYAENIINNICSIVMEDDEVRKGRTYDVESCVWGSTTAEGWGPLQ